MSLVSESPVRALKFCLDATCPGYEQREVDGILNVTSHSYLDGGGDLGPFPERSMEYLRFADPEDAACDVCGKAAEISQQTRPVYPKSSNQPVQQSSDVNMAKLYMDQREAAEAEKAAMRAEMDDLKALVAAQARSKPGPKPKVD